jgi:hypothetical protein
MRLLLGPALLFLACCSHAAESPKEEPKDHFEAGWQNIKQGGREVATGVAAGAKKAGTAIHALACPVAADIQARVYYAKDSPGYEKMLSAEKSNVRECFASEAAAREKGYTLVR